MILHEKLGLKEGMSTHFSHAPVKYFEALGGNVYSHRPDDDGTYDFIHAFFTEKEQLVASAQILTSKLADDGILWISYPSNSQELTERIVSEVLSTTGMISRETIEIIDNWLATKFVLA
jgi:hypothetical protein